MQNKKKIFGLLTSASLLLSGMPLSVLAEEMIEIPEAINEKIEEDSGLEYINESGGPNHVFFTEKANTSTSAVVTTKEEQLEKNIVHINVSSYPYTFPTSSEAFGIVDDDGNKVEVTTVSYKDQNDKVISGNELTITKDVSSYRAVVNTTDGDSILVTVSKVDPDLLNQAVFTDAANTTNAKIIHTERKIDSYPYVDHSFLVETSFPYTLPQSTSAFKVTDPTGKEVSVSSVTWTKYDEGKEVEVKDTTITSQSNSIVTYCATLKNAEGETIGKTQLGVGEKKNSDSSTNSSTTSNSSTNSSTTSSSSSSSSTTITSSSNSSSTASSSSSGSSSSSSSSSSSDNSSTGTGGGSTVTTSRPKLVVEAGAVIAKTDGKLESKELKTLENYIEAHNNPYGYEFTINNASVSTKDGQSTFTMSVTAKLEDESRIDLTIRNLKKRNRSEDAMIEEDEFVEFSDLEELEAASLDYDYVYDKDGDGKKVVIKGIATKDAFRINDNLNGTSVRTILNDAGYKVSNLNFNSSAKKNNTFSIKDLNDPISIEVTTSTQTSTVSTPVSGGGTIAQPTTPSIPTTPSVVRKPTYRFFNTLTGEHFYTTSEAERNELLKDSRWNNEGVAWTAPESSDYIIYRVCNPNTGEHHFTMDKNEYDTLQTRGWRGEGIGFYSANPNDANIVQLYRLYNPKANNAGSHHYTASEAERDSLVKDGWNYEGVAWYGLK